MKIIIGSRGSVLAIKQSEEVKKAIEKFDPSFEVEIKVIKTKGDQILDKPLQQIGDKGLFTREIEKQLLEGSIDLAVHSSKDMPSSLPEGLILASTITPNDYRDCVVFNHHYHSLDELPQGSIIGTGSPRRKYQILKYRPDLKVINVRGNVITRLKKMVDEDIDALILASAGLKRLGLEEKIGQYLDTSIMIPACNQGILAIEMKEDSPLFPMIEKISDQQATRRMRLERLFLETIGGSCHVPIGVHVEILDNGIQFDAIYGDEIGKQVIKHSELIEEHYEDRIKEIAFDLKERIESNG